MIAVFAFGCGTSVVGQLVNLGTSGEYFQDTSTGLYWYDPAHWVGQSRATIDAYVVSHPNWAWATSAQISALNGKSAPTGQSLVSVMGAQQYTLSNGGPRWIGYHASIAQPDGWLVQSFSSTGFATLDGTSQQFNVTSWGPGAWLVSTFSPVSTLSLTQPFGSGSLQVSVFGAGIGGANYFTAFSFDPANVTAPGLGWWHGLQISFLDLVGQAQTGSVPFIGTLDAAGNASFVLPPGVLSPSLPPLFAVTTFFDATWTVQLGFTTVQSLTIM